MGRGHPAAHLLEGSWIATVTPTGGQAPFKALLTFTTDGGLIQTDTSPEFETPGHGEWVRTGDRQFTIGFVNLLFDDQGEFGGTKEIRENITLNDTSDEYTGVSRVDFFDANGNLIRSTSARTQGTRIHVEPLE
ncbi:MAG: hypothetical protein HY314_13145 [Acidobacteria bacterium]|nr:hypothetical protein [Acidobacteriota bacterium]